VDFMNHGFVVHDISEASDCTAVDNPSGVTSGKCLFPGRVALCGRVHIIRPERSISQSHASYA
jgi:hypothetical protein